MINKIISILQGWGRLIREVESILVDNIAATTPWLAPLVPAYMVYQAMTSRLDFPVWMAWAGAIVVEFLGLSAVVTSFQLWDWNDRYSVGQRAPVALAVSTAVFYITVVVTVNVLLDDSMLLYKVAKALLSLLSIVAGVILAIRAQHSRRISARLQVNEMRKVSRKVSVEIPVTSESFRKLPESGDKLDWRHLTESEKLSLRGKTPAEIRRLYPMIEDRTAWNWSERGNGHHVMESQSQREL